jgi:hypothetical protein
VRDLYGCDALTGRPEILLLKGSLPFGSRF